MKTAQQAAANWVASAPRAGQAWTDGVNGYNGDWAAATVAQEQVALAAINRAFADGSWRQGVMNTGTSGWKSATLASTANFSNGFQKGAAKQAQSAQKIMNALQNIVPNLPARGDFNQNVVRATTLMSQLHSLKGSLKG